jgi:peptide/nickel transport system ATP-binding protein
MNAPQTESMLLQVRDLRVTLPTPRGPAQALRGVSFDLARGQTMGLIGESGCGKSLTAMAIMGLLPETARVQGSIRLAGEELVGSNQTSLARLRGSRMAMIFQEPMTALNPLHPVWRQIAEPLRLHQDLSASRARQKALALLERVQLPRARERLDAYPHQLSGGQRQRVMIAMALACGPDLLIADEPTTALDVTIQKEVLTLIAQLVREDAMSLLFISHDLALLRDQMDRVMVMYGGQVVESASTAALFDKRAHPYTRGLFAARPRLGLARGTRLQTIPGRVPELSDLPEGCAFAERCPQAVGDCERRQPELLPLATVPVRPGLANAANLANLARVASEANPANVVEGHWVRCPRWDLPGAVPDLDRLAASSFGGAKSLPTRIPALAATARPNASGGQQQWADSDAATLLELRHISQSYLLPREKLFRRPGALQALRDVSLTLQAGKSLGIVGESGSGKSTLARLVMALEKPTAGQVFFRGQDLAALSPSELRAARCGFQMVFQDPYGSLDPRQTVGRIVTEPLQADPGVTLKERLRRAEDAMTEVGLRPADLGKYPHEFSGGQRQRIAIARALITRPALIVADEPVSALDVSVQAQVLNLMQDLQDRLGLSYLFISHDLAVVNLIADEVLVLQSGCVVEQGATQALFDNPKHPYTRQLLAAIPGVGRL